MLGGPAAAGGRWAGGEKHILIIKDRGSNICFLPSQPPLMATYVQLHVVGGSGGSSLKGGEGVNTGHVSHAQPGKLHCTPPSLWRSLVINNFILQKSLSNPKFCRKQEENNHLALCFQPTATKNCFMLKIKQSIKFLKSHVSKQSYLICL